MESIRLGKRSRIAELSQCGFVCVIAAVVTACGLQNGPASGTSHRAHRAHRTHPAHRTPQATAGGQACGRPDLRVKLDTHSAGVAAGTSYIPLDFTNVSAAGCRLSGFPVVTLAASSAGKQIGSAGTADRSLAAENLELRAGQTAHIWLRLVDVANLPRAQCRPVTAAGLRISLPADDATIFIKHSVTTCAKRVNGTDLLTVEPFQAGRALPGRAQ